MAYPIERNGKWYVAYKEHNGRRKRQVTTATTKRECQRLADEFENQAWRRRTGLEAVPTDCTLTLQEACNWWLSERCPAPSVSREKSRLQTHVMDHQLATRRVADIDHAAIDSLLRELEKGGQAPGSINKLRATLSTVFANAIDAQKWSGKNPVHEVKARRVPKRVFETLRAEEVPLVLANATDAWRDLFATALYLGLRKGELFGLRKADVRLEERSLVVRHSHEREGTKGGDEALLPIPEPLANYLKNALDTAPGPLLFPRADGKARKPSTSVEKVLRRALARAKLVTGYRHTCRSCAAKKRPYSAEYADGELRRCPQIDEATGKLCNAKLWPTMLPRWMRFHDLRHTTATLLLKARVPMYIVQKILRHADIKTTVGIYGHLDIEDSREALKSLPDAPMRERGSEFSSGAAIGTRSRVPSVSQETEEAGKEESPGPENVSESGALDWSGTPGSNWRPSPWQGDALPTELVPQNRRPF